jgi:enamine deaminase RidA (YjgF/YER057c/UK114 family)
MLAESSMTQILDYYAETIHQPGFALPQSGQRFFSCATGGKIVYISGQTAWDAHRKIVGGPDLAQQARQALRNLQTAIEAAGGTLADVVALRIYIVNYTPAQADAIGGALREFFPKEKRPASTWIGVSSLAVSDFLIEIEATAVLE